MISYNDQFNVTRGLIQHYIDLCKQYKLDYTHEADGHLPLALEELKTIILTSIKQANFNEREHLYQIMWFAKIPDKEVLLTLLKGLLDALNEPLQKPHILQVFVFVFQQSVKALLEVLWLADLVKPMAGLIETCAKMLTPGNIPYLSTALAELNLLFDEMIKCSVRLADQYKEQLTQLATAAKEIARQARQERAYELLDKITYTKAALAILTKKDPKDLAFGALALVDTTVGTVASLASSMATFGASSITLIKDAARLAIQMRELSKAYPSLPEIKEWYGFVQNIRQLIALNVLTEKLVPDITPDEIAKLWKNFEDNLFAAISKNGEKLYFNISLLSGLAHVVESLSNLILLGNRAESLAVSIATQETIVALTVSIYHLKLKKSGLKRRVVKTHKDLIANLKIRIEIYLQAFAQLPAQDHVISLNKVLVLTKSVPENCQVAEQVRLLLNKFKSEQDSFVFTSNLVFQAWEQSLSCSYVYYKLLQRSRNELTKAVPVGQSAVKQKALYMKPMCREGQEKNSASGDLRDYLNKFLSSKQRVLWLLGDPGSGKTFAAHELTEQLLDEYEPGKYLPVLITLPSYSEPQCCLRTLFSEILHGHDGYLEIMSNIKQDNNQPLVFIFEAYDEVFTTEPFDVYSGASLQSNHLEDWPNIKVFITVRTNYKPDEKSFKRLLLSCPPEQQAIIYLEPFNKTQIGWYLENFLTLTEKKKPEDSRLDRLMRKIMQPAIKSLAQNPLLLSYLVEELALLDEEMTQSIRLRLYDRLLIGWFERAAKKLKNDTLTLDVIEEFFKELAFRMFKQETITAPDLTQRTEFLKFWNTDRLVIRNLFGDPNFEKLLHGLPLKRVMQLPEAHEHQESKAKAQPQHVEHQHKGYRFIHDTIRTYYLAKYLFDQLKRDDQATKMNEEISIDKYATSFRDTGIMQTPDSDDVLDTLVELIKCSDSKSKIVRKLDSLLENGSTHARAWGLSVLTRGKFISFYRKNLSGVRMPYANLEGGDFPYTDFSNSDLDHARIKDAHICGANFFRASFAGATISGESTSYYPKKIIIDHKKRWVVSYDSNNVLAIRELGTGTLVSTKSFQDNIVDIALVHSVHDIAVLTERSKSKRSALHFYQLNQDKLLVVSKREPPRLASKSWALIPLPGVKTLCWSYHNKLVSYNLDKKRKTVRKLDSSNEITVKKIVIHWRRLACLLSNHRVAVYRRDDLLAIDQTQELKSMLLLNPKHDPIRDIALCTSEQTRLRVLMAKEQKIVIANFKFDESGAKVCQSLQRIESTAMYLACCGFNYVVWACNHQPEPTPEQRQRSNMFFRKLDEDFTTKHDYDHDPDSIALLGHADAVTDMKAYEAEDKQMLISAGEDGVIHRWELDTKNNSWELIWRSGIGLHARGCKIEGASLSKENGEKLKAFGAIGQYKPLNSPQPNPHIPGDPLPPSQPVNKSPDIYISSEQPIEPEFDY